MKTYKQAQMEKALSSVEKANLIRCYHQITAMDTVDDEWMRKALEAIIYCAPMVVRRRSEFGAAIKLEGWFPDEKGGFICVGMVEGEEKCALTECDESLWDYLLPSVIEEGDLSCTVWEKTSGEHTPERIRVNSQIGELASVSFWDFKNEKWGMAARHMFKSTIIKHYREIKEDLKGKGVEA